MFSPNSTMTMGTIANINDWTNCNMQGFSRIFFWMFIGTFSIYFGMGTFLHFYYYRAKRDLAHLWKCQPEKWLDSDLELNEIILGSFNLIFGSGLGATLATYILNGGAGTTVYYCTDECGYLWFICQVPVTFLLVDYLYYWHHRLYHLPWFYKRFHKIHHSYKQPTSFALFAFHPLEQFTELVVVFCPVFLFPVYWLNVIVIYIYMFIHGILEHSGINFTRFWWQPWQTETKFHDIHHEQTHFNFGLNLDLWDKLHGTVWQKLNKK